MSSSKAVFAQCHNYSCIVGESVFVYMCVYIPYIHYLHKCIHAYATVLSVSHIFVCTVHLHTFICIPVSVYVDMKYLHAVCLVVQTWSLIWELILVKSRNNTPNRNALVPLLCWTVSLRVFSVIKVYNIFLKSHFIYLL